MRNLATALLCAGIAACVSEHEALRNDRGQVVNCSNEGWGWIGAPVAMANQSDCIKKAEAAGFHKPGIAESATAASKPSGQQKPPSPPGGAAATQPVPAAATNVTPASNSAPAAKVGSPVDSTADRLRKLEDLFKSGLITKEEYDRKRQEILSTL